MLSLNTRLFNQTVAAILLGAALATHSAAFAAPPRVGEAFPALGNFGLTGPIPDLHGKVVLIDFWASWCAPCKRSFPVMKELQNKYGARGFVVVAVSVDEKKAAMDDFLKKNPIPFVVLHDAKGHLARAMALEKMPTSFLVGADDKITAMHTGFEGESTRKAYVTEIERALDSVKKL